MTASPSRRPATLRYALTNTQPLTGEIDVGPGQLFMEIERPSTEPGVTLCERHRLMGALSLRLHPRADDEIPVEVAEVELTSASKRYALRPAPKDGLHGFLNADTGEGVLEGALDLRDDEHGAGCTLGVRAGVCLDARTGVFEVETVGMEATLPAFKGVVSVRLILAALCGCFTKKCTTRIVARRAVSCIGGDDCTGATPTCTLHSRSKGKPRGRWTKEASNKDVPYDATMDYLCFCA